MQQNSAQIREQAYALGLLYILLQQGVEFDEAIEITSKEFPLRKEALTALPKNWASKELLVNALSQSAHGFMKPVAHALGIAYDDETMYAALLLSIRVLERTALLTEAGVDQVRIAEVNYLDTLSSFTSALNASLDEALEAAGSVGIPAPVATFLYNWVMKHNDRLAEGLGKHPTHFSEATCRQVHITQMFSDELGLQDFAIFLERELLIGKHEPAVPGTPTREDLALISDCRNIQRYVDLMVIRIADVLELQYKSLDITIHHMVDMQYTFAEALNAKKDLFPEFVVKLLQMAYQKGDLSEGFSVIASYLEWRYLGIQKPKTLIPLLA
jgi:hypothetical protein